MCKIGANPIDERAGVCEEVWQNQEYQMPQCRKVESRYNCNFTKVNGLHDIVREFEQSGLSGVKFAIGRL